MDHRNKKELKKSHSRETAEPEINSGLKTIREKKSWNISGVRLFL